MKNWDWKSLIVNIFVGVIASLIAAGLSFHFFQESINSIVNKSLKIIKFDEAVKALADIDKHQISNDDFCPNETNNMHKEMSRIRAELTRLANKADAISKEADILFVALDKLPVNGGPAKVFDDILIPEPGRAYKNRLGSLKIELVKLNQSLAETNQLIDNFEIIIQNAKAAYLKYAQDQMSKIKHEANRARFSLSDRTDTLVNVLKDLKREK